jgi:hypothetical protein
MSRAVCGASRSRCSSVVVQSETGVRARKRSPPQPAALRLSPLAPARYKAAHGGRGSGKSHFFAGMGVEAPDRNALIGLGRLGDARRHIRIQPCLRATFASPGKSRLMS